MFLRYLRPLVPKSIVTIPKPTLQASTTRIPSVHHLVRKQITMQQPRRVMIRLTLHMRMPPLSQILFFQQLIRKVLPNCAIPFILGS